MLLYRTASIFRNARENVAFIFIVCLFLILAFAPSGSSATIPSSERELLQRILANSTESVGLPMRPPHPMLPAWNVSSTCLPIEQELVEQCRLLLLACPIGVDDGEEWGRAVARSLGLVQYQFHHRSIFWRRK
jgi:hypothetical protein